MVRFGAGGMGGVVGEEIARQGARADPDEVRDDSTRCQGRADAGGGTWQVSHTYAQRPARS